MSVSPSSTSTSTGTTTPTSYHCHAATQFQTVVQGYKDGNLTKEECISACNAFLSHEEHHRWCKAEAYLLLSHCSDNLFGSIAHAEKARRIFNKVFVGRGVRATEAKEQLRVTTSRILDLKVEAYSRPPPPERNTQMPWWKFVTWARSKAKRIILARR